MALSSLPVVVFCLLSHCLLLQISIVEAEKVSVISFEFNGSSADGVKLNGDARFVPGYGIDLTNNTRSIADDEGRSGSAGRAAYNETIQLWTASTKTVANFTSHFQFQMDWTGPGADGDGLAFYMAPEESGYQVQYRGDGGWLGLFNSDNNGSSDNHVVVVEFDTFSNSWDPDTEFGDHVGIDVNSINSVANVSLNQSLNEGNVWNAWIDCHGQENMLKVSVSLKSSRNYVLSNWTNVINLTDTLAEKVVVGFSAGAVASNETHRLIYWNFTSVISYPEKSSKRVLIMVSLPSVTVLILFFLGIYIVYRRRGRQRSEEVDEADMEADADMNVIMDHVPRKFTYAELSAGTNHFSEKQKLGQGGFGIVYKGILVKSNEIVAVKRISAGSKQGKKEYLAEISTITRLRHRNLVQLLGWCHEKGQLLLVYEYMPNGSLDSLLYGKRRGQLDWAQRYRIAANIASALLYLHELWDECVVHRDIKSSNVMLDSEFNAKLGDFGLARLVKHDQWSQTTTIAGTPGYLAPECTVTGISSTESDVFSFGAVALEIVCGRRALDSSLEKSKVRLVEWVWDLYGQGRLYDAADSSLNGEFDRAEMESLVVIGLWCSHPDPFTRPKIRQVLQLLDFEVPMPHLPRTLPKAAYAPIQEGFFSNISNGSQPDLTSSQEMAVFSSSAVFSDMPTTSTGASASTNSSIAMSKSSVI